MKGDFSRIRFEKTKHYTAVLEQQGRIAVDADHNEQRAIDRNLRETETVDIIGPYGAPRATKVSPSLHRRTRSRSALAVITCWGFCARTKLR